VTVVAGDEHDEIQLSTSGDPEFANKSIMDCFGPDEMVPEHTLFCFEQAYGMTKKMPQIEDLFVGTNETRLICKVNGPEKIQRSVAIH